MSLPSPFRLLLAAALVLGALTTFVTSARANHTQDHVDAQVAAALTTVTPIPQHSFAYTGGVQQWTVPAGVTSVTIRMRGGGGGAACDGGAGGAGGKVTAKLTVTPGQVLDLIAGGAGQGCGGNRAGGWGGGAYDGGAGGPGSGGGGSGGGGASAVLVGGTAKIVAGGGGAGGAYYVSGGAAGAAGAASYYGTAGGGQGATVASVGAGGSGPFTGASGVAGKGGAGGGNASSTYSYGGGGGGGGYRGGGGGGGDYYDYWNYDGGYGAGGGGGSSYVDPAAVSSDIALGGSGDGNIVIYEGDLPPAQKALIHAESVAGGASSYEAESAEAAGFEVTLVNSATWSTMTQADFAQYRLLIVGESRVPSSVLSTASVWAPVVMGKAVRTRSGNRILIGTDPIEHGYSGGLALVRAAVAYAGAVPGTTGLYFANQNGDSMPATLAALSEGAGTWTQSNNPPCGGAVAVIAKNDAFSTVTRNGLAGWECSVHVSFPTFADDWSPLAVATDTETKPTCGTDLTVNPTQDACGQAYVLVAGGGTVLVAPNLSLTPADATSQEGGDHTVTASLSDKNAANAPLVGQAVTFTVTGQNAGVTGTCAPVDCKTGSDGTVSFTYHDVNGDGDDTITASFTDAGGSKQQANAVKHWTAKPDNTAPVVTFAGDAEREYGEGATERVFDYTATDADVGDTLVVVTECGAGGTKVSDEDTDGDGTRTLRCVYADGTQNTFATGEWPTTVRATATDGKSESGSDTVAVRVLNKAPDAPVVTGLTTFDSDTPHNWTFTSDDPADADDASIKYRIDWGDGSAEEVVTGGLSEEVEHLYSANCSCPLTVTAEDKDGGTSTATTYPLVVTPWLKASAGPVGGYKAVEGDTVTLDGSGSGGELARDLTYAWDVNGDGKFTDSTEMSPTLTWDQLVALGINDGPTSRSMRLRVTDPERTMEAAATLLIGNAPPKLTLMTPPAEDAVVGKLATWTFAATDPSPVDQAALRFTVAWGDGKTDTKASPITHAYTLPAEYAVSAFALDKEGGRSETQTRDELVGGAVDAAPQGGLDKTLMIGGTSGNDTFTVKSGGLGKVVVMQNGVANRTFSTTSAMVILLAGGDGNDTLVVEADVPQKAMAFGGAGDDVVEVRNSNGVASGGPGTDTVNGGAGREMLYGGDGLDVLDGKAGEDVLVAGRVAWERATSGDRLSLDKLQDEWLRTDATFPVRVSHLEGATRGLNATTLLKASDPSRTVFDDIEVDALTGGLGTDWLLANRLAPGVLDTVVGTGDTIGELTP